MRQIFTRRLARAINGKERAYDLECAQGSYPAYCPNYFDRHTQATLEAVIDAWPNVTTELVESAWSALEVQVAPWMQYEKLISIEYSGEVQKKSAAGRAAGAVFTGGLNLLASNKRGDIYLTIVTENTTHQLHQDPPTAPSIRAVQQLAAAGKGVLARLDADASRSAPIGSAPPGVEHASVTERLHELMKLHEEGTVSDKEFEELRSNLLKDL
jgi:hypothetical protein